MTEPAPEKPSLTEAVVRGGLGAIPTVGPLLAELFSYALELDRWRVYQTGIHALDAVGDNERFVRALQGDARLLDMLLRAGGAAAVTDWEAKRIAMGRVLGQAIIDDSQVEELAVMLNALASLEPIHYRYLGRLEQHPEEPFDGPDDDRLVPEPFRSQLQSVGVASVHTIWGGNAFRAGESLIGVNGFGGRFLRWIREADESEPLGDPSPASPT